MRFSTRYPDGKSKKQYIEYVIALYTKDDLVYLFSQEQINIPITSVIDLVVNAIESTDNIQSKLTIINLLRRFINDESFFPLKFLETHPVYLSLYSFQKGRISASRIELKQNGIDFPEEQKEDYVAFTRQMSQEVIIGICDATERLVNTLQGDDKKENVNLVSGKTFSELTTLTKKRVSFFFGDNEEVPSRPGAKDRAVCRHHNKSTE
jgi:hypothetical protein